MCGLDRDAPVLAAPGERILRTDELTGGQTRERKPPPVPLAPGHGARPAFADSRPGTGAFRLHRDVVTGEIVAPACGPTRTAEACVAHLAPTGASDPTATRWHFVVDNRDSHQSAGLVRWVAQATGLDLDLGKQGQPGLRQRCRRRAAFLRDPSQLGVFHDTPKHSSWLHQSERWVSILARKGLKRGAFGSVEALRATVLAFIASYNRTANPFKWTDQGKPLVA